MPLPVLQQGWLAPPHISQTFGPVPGAFEQFRPEPHTLPEQQAWPLPPQGAHA
jgi:hypothetical protein